MTRLQIAAAFAAVATSVVQGHFTFARLSLNGEWLEPLRYIRNKTSPYEEASTPNTNVNTRLYNFPTYPTDFPESVRCGRGNLAHGAETDVLTVKAGDTIEVAHVRAEPYEWDGLVQWNGCAEGRGSCYVPGTLPDEIMDFNHPGPLLAHLSKVPDGEDVRSYDGSGEWTKIHSLGLELNDDGSLHWLGYNYQGLPGRFVFKIPEQTPAGEYLLRLDLIWPALVYLSSVGDDAQLYPTCAQIAVESAVNGDLPKGIKIPEELKGVGVPGMSSSLSMYREESLDEGYVYPAGLLWTGEELIEDKPQT